MMQDKDKLVNLQSLKVVYDAIEQEQEKLNTALATVPKDVQINGTSIKDADGVANIPFASKTVAGVMKVGNGLGTVSNDTVFVTVASDQHISSRTSQRMVDASKINTAVTAALTDSNHLTMTSDQMDTCCSVIGAERAKKYELIDTITLTEATSIIEKTSQPDGTPYDFIGVCIMIDAKPSTGAGSYDAYLYDTNDNFLSMAVFSNILSGSNSTASKSVHSIIGGTWVTVYASCANSTVWYNNSYIISCARETTIVPSSEHCTKISIRNRNIPIMQPGSVVKIYAIRA